MKVPFFGLDREYKKYRNHFLEIFENVMIHGKVLQGPEVGEFEETLTEITGRKHAVAVNSCTDALYFSLKALGVNPGDEVMVTSYSFIASASCILRIKATPVFVDVDDDFHMDLASMERMNSSKVKAIIYPHMFGNISDMSGVIQFAQENGIPLIEDAAQSLGAEINNVKSGSFGDCSCISFDPTKVIGAPGSGGVFLTDEKKLADHVRILRYHGKDQKQGFVECGYNSQMPTLTASILNFKLHHFKEFELRRQKIAKFYSENLNSEVKTQTEKPNSNHIFHKFVLEFKDSTIRNQVLAHLKTLGIGCMIHYNMPLNKNKLFDKRKYRRDSLTKCESLCSLVLSLPIHPWLTNDEISFVVDSVNDFVGS